MRIHVRDSFVEVPGGRVFVRRWALEDHCRDPIILLHDSLGSVEQWRDFPAALAQLTARDVIAYDRLGFGRSTARTRQLSLEFISEEAATFFPAVARTLGSSRFALFGHSVGGAMAVVIAASHPEACAAVITEAAQAFVEERTLSGIRSAAALFVDPVQFEKLGKWHGDKARWVLDAWAGIWLSPEFRSWELAPYLAQLRCPVLAIHGDRDEYGSVEFPRCIAAKANGPADLAILEACGHVPHRERQEEVLRLSASFLERVSAEAVKAPDETTRAGTRRP